jgi:hypothetical protein
VSEVRVHILSAEVALSQPKCVVRLLIEEPAALRSLALTVHRPSEVPERGRCDGFVQRGFAQCVAAILKLAVYPAFNS